MTQPLSSCPQQRPLAWYMATGYGLPAGIEAHILHYATEMRNHGFDTRVVVFKPLPGGGDAEVRGRRSEVSLSAIAPRASAEGQPVRHSSRSVGGRSEVRRQETGDRNQGQIPNSDSPSTIHHSPLPSPHSPLSANSASPREIISSSRHRFLIALEERGIPIASLYDRVALRARALACLAYLPWRVWRLRESFEQKGAKGAKDIAHRVRMSGEQIVNSDSLMVNREGETSRMPGYDGQRARREEREGVEQKDAKGAKEMDVGAKREEVSSLRTWELEGRGARVLKEIHGTHPDIRGPTGDSPSTTHHSLLLWMQRRLGFRELRRMLRRERPDIIHVFGRLPFGSWGILPPERTIFHEMMTGTIDNAWTDYELAEFREFAGRCARVFAPGTGVAANMVREFGITRPIDPIFTMCPDELSASR